MLLNTGEESLFFTALTQLNLISQLTQIINFLKCKTEYRYNVEANLFYKQLVMELDNKKSCKITLKTFMC